MTEGARVEQLLAILERKPDTLLPQFCEALKASDQSHVVKILMKNGLNARAAIILSNTKIAISVWHVLVFAPNWQRLYNIFSQVSIFLLHLVNIFELMQ